MTGVSSTTASVIRSAALDDLIAALAGRGYTVIGPRVRDGAIVYEEISSAADLPEGITDEQEGGTYRLHDRDDDALFGFNNGPNSWKHHLFPPNLTLWKAQRAEDGAISYEEEAEERPRYAFLGVRSCDLAAIAVQDKVFIGDSLHRRRLRGPPPRRLHRRDQLLEGGQHLLLRLDGHRPASEVRVRPGPDRAAREASTASWSRWARSGARRCWPRSAPSRPSRPMRPPRQRLRGVRVPDGPRARHRRDQGAALPEHGAPALGRGLRALPDLRQLHARLPDLLLPHGRGHDATWPARRPSGCASGTPASPSTTPTSTAAACVTAAPSRYRQWMTHKLATWIDQFGTSGCVGCGRCITWCPVAIDITEEAAAIRATDLGPAPEGERGISADH